MGGFPEQQLLRDERPYERYGERLKKCAGNPEQTDDAVQQGQTGKDHHRARRNHLWRFRRVTSASRYLNYFAQYHLWA